ncbi:hypothetical protein LCGC14_1245660 [marine sediment metagenome]|uniref:Uncharacterized protein n=1 Tax=marine sediment metagenome TaxID=412755 RepID=A0A0F9L4H8_9ZZZZ
MRRLLLWLHNKLGDILDCYPGECRCQETGYEEAKDTVAEWFTPPERLA